ncbi:M23 family metallopeptidase [Oscillospiraceae bacterium MB08-C2-2]|nr:M23 family metallopeptidase [Oscillospiraceae bacterium MB08-C2-2]
MSKMNFSKGKFSRFISSKGFYVALAVCLMGAGVATWLAVDRTLNGIEQNNQQMLENDYFLEQSVPLQPAEKKDENQQQPSSKPSASSPEVSSQPEASSEPAKPSAQPAASPVSPSLPATVYALPVKGDIINPYSNGELVKNISLNDWRTHDGVDIRAEKGTQVMSAADGTVKSVASDPLWGTVVTISHKDGHETIYAGLGREVMVATGDNVMVRQVIGSIDSIPCEVNDPSHLHFAMKKDSAWCDPLSVISRA